MNGWINLYKPSGYSSTFCLNLIKKKFKLKKIGHLGTLDPMAEGVLPIAINEATKTINYINHSKKKYLFEVQWGVETDTLDSEGKVIKTTSDVPGLIIMVPPYQTAVSSIAAAGFSQSQPMARRPMIRSP